MIRRNRRTVAVVLAGALVAGGCSASHRGHASPPARPAAPAVPVAPVSELSYAVAAEVPGNWNILAAGTDQQALAPVADQVWPSVFTFGPDLNPILNTALVQSANETSSNPQTVVYRINPKATWSDGTPVSGADFVYNWRAQSGRAGTSDLGGKPFTPETSAVYSDVQAVTVSGASADVVTVLFSSPTPDWTALFRHVVPAHVAQQVGFDSGFTDPVSDLVSDGPYLVGSYDPSGVVHLVRNPSYSGPPAGALELDIRYVPDTSQLLSALSEGQVSCADVPATASAVSSVKASGNLAVSIGAGSWYVDLVFNTASGPMSTSDARASITKDVSPPAAISDALRGVDPQAQPLANRFLVPGESGYAANAAPVAPPLQRPSTSTSVPTAIRLAVAGTTPEMVAVAQSIAEQLDAAGLAVTTDVVGDASQLSAGGWDLAVVLRQLTPWPFEALAAYRSGGPANVGRLSDPALDNAIQSALSAPAAQQKGLVDQVDIAAWEAFADVPIVALPQVLACQTGVSGPAVNRSPDGTAYNAASWGFKGAPS